MLSPTGEMVCLIKPQFEAGREKVGKKGVVRDPKVHKEVIDKVLAFARQMGFFIINLDFSPIKGPEGNIEYLVHIKKGAEMYSQNIPESVTAAQEEIVDIPGIVTGIEEEIVDVSGIVARAHEALQSKTPRQAGEETGQE